MTGARTLVWATPALLLSLGGCGDVVKNNLNDGGVDDGGNGDGGDSTADAALPDPCLADEVPLEDLRTCFIRAQCDVISRCGFLNFFREECEELFANAADIDSTLDSVAAGRTEYDPVAASACISGLLESTGCFVELGEACDQVFVGQIEPGDDCYSEEECAGNGAFCTKSCGGDDQCCTGTCVAAVPTNGSCAEDGAECMDGDHCVFHEEMAGSFCYDGHEGSFCTSNSHCDDAFYCSGDSCVPRLPLHSFCDENAQCEAPFTCVGESQGLGSCKPVDYAGASCDGVCLGLLWCDRSGGPIGICRDDLPEGASCLNGGNCQGSLLCIDGTCTPRPGVGEPCYMGACAHGLVCTSDLPDGNPPNTCVELVDNGGACDDEYQCKSGICNETDNPGICEEYENCFE